MKLLDAGDDDINNSSTSIDYDTGNESVSSKSSSYSRIARKSFKPSAKKRIQLTFENLTVKSLSKRKSFLFC